MTWTELGIFVFLSLILSIAFGITRSLDEIQEKQRLMSLRILQLQGHDIPGWMFERPRKSRKPSRKEQERIQAQRIAARDREFFGW